MINPSALNDPVPYGYSHAVSELLFVAGQYAAGPDGQIPSDDFADQVERSFANVGAVLDAVGLGFGHVVRLGTYVVDHDASKLAILGAVLHRIWGDAPPAQTLVGVAALSLPDMRFEVDAVAVRP